MPVKVKKEIHTPHQSTISHVPFNSGLISISEGLLFWPTSAGVSKISESPMSADVGWSMSHQIFLPSAGPINDISHG
jgi:hypothetical protein